MRGPCMCGDLYCSSCGPAQGSSHCPACGKWADDGGCDNQDACREQNRRNDEEMALFEARAEVDAASYWGTKPPAWALKVLAEGVPQ